MVGQYQNAIWIIKSAVSDEQACEWFYILKDEKLAEAIGESFYRMSSDITPLNFQPIQVTSVPDSYTIFPEAVEAQLSRGQEGKTTGPDEIPNWILKSCASTLSVPISPSLMPQSRMATYRNYRNVRTFCL